MSSPKVPCPCCGWRRGVSRLDDLNKPCRDCKRDIDPPTEADALTGGHWVMRGQIKVWVETPPPPPEPEPQPEPEPEPAARELVPCGTYGGFGRHRYRGEDACDNCKEAARTYWRVYRRKSRARARMNINPIDSLADLDTTERYLVIEAWKGSVSSLERLTGWDIERMLRLREAA